MRLSVLLASYHRVFCSIGLFSPSTTLFLILSHYLSTSSSLADLAAVLVVRPWRGIRYLMSSPTTHSTSSRCILWWTRPCLPSPTGPGFSRLWFGEHLTLQKLLASESLWAFSAQDSNYFKCYSEIQVIKWQWDSITNSQWPIFVLKCSEPKFPTYYTSPWMTKQ